MAPTRDSEVADTETQPYVTAAAAGMPAARGPGRAPWIAAAVVTATLLWAYAAVFRWLWRTWLDDPNYSHGPLVIPVAALIAWRRWDGKEGPSPPWPWAWGLLAATLGVRAYAVEQGKQWAEAVTLLPVLGCLALTLGGGGLFRRIWPAIAFLVFMIPLTGNLDALLALPLQSLATGWSCAVLKLTGLWVIAEGNVIYVGRQPLEVATACNGLSMLMCLSATVVAAVLLVPMAVWVRVVLILSAAPIALASNVLRIAATAWCYHRFGPEVGGPVAHDGAGWLMMPAAVLLVLIELCLINWLVKVEEVEVPPTILGLPIRGNPKDQGAPGGAG